MKILIIGGTGTISSAITRQLAAEGHDLLLLNRGNRSAELPHNVKLITGDINDHTDEVMAKLGEETFDAVCEFIGFHPEQVERDIRLFSGRTKQYVFISSASAYNKPARQHVITEGTTLANPYWEYSRNKIACEAVLMQAYRETGFPMTIIRPSHTYCEREVPVGVHGSNGSWQVLKRMIEGKPVIVHGDGSSLWTMTWNEDFAPSAYDLRGALLGDKAVTVRFDCSKLKRAVPGFCATTHLDQGVRKAVTHIMNHPELQREDPEFDAWCAKVIETLEAAKASLAR